MHGAQAARTIPSLSSSREGKFLSAGTAGHRANPPKHLSLERQQLREPGECFKSQRKGLGAPGREKPAVRSNLAHVEFTDLFPSSVKATLIMLCYGKWELFYISGRRHCCVIWDIPDDLKPLLPGIQCEPSRFSQEFFGCWEVSQTRIKPFSKDVSPAARHGR